MEETHISFETAKLAKEKGFIDINNSNTNGHFSTQTLLQKWLREKYKINAYPILSYTNNQKYTIELRYDFSKIKSSQTGLTEKIYYDTYEEALKLGLQEGLKLIK